MDIRNENRMTVQKDGAPIYDIVISETFKELCEEMRGLGTRTKKLCIVTDSNVAPLYGEEVLRLLSGCAKKVLTYVFPAGEENKNLDTVKGIYEFLIENKFDRTDLLVALGGGVVGDICGFAAATYLRGIDFIQIPTTLLAQVDSSIGGKTGVDFDAYKNMVGAFHMPKLVYTNVSVLRTLAEEQYSAGMGEVIKHGLIRDRGYYQWIMEHKEQISERDPDTCRMLILGSNRIKREVVEIDPTEQNERATLNFGHTLGHAIEKLKGFSLLHGHCVALGALAAMKLCQERGLVSEAEVADYREAMAYFKMPVRAEGLNMADVIAATKNDKKMEAGIIKFILLKEVGQAYIDRTVTETEMAEALSAIM